MPLTFWLSQSRTHTYPHMVSPPLEYYTHIEQLPIYAGPTYMCVPLFFRSGTEFQRLFAPESTAGRRKDREQTSRWLLQEAREKRSVCVRRSSSCKVAGQQTSNTGWRRYHMPTMYAYINTCNTRKAHGARFAFGSVFICRSRRCAVNKNEFFNMFLIAVR